MMKNKRIVLCADDYAYHTGISNAIIDLINKKRISAVSCMSNMPLWQEHAAWLKPYCKQLDVGLHFNLTDGKPLSKAAQRFWPNGFPSMLNIISQSHLRVLPTTIINDELTAQIERFTQFIGQLPDHIDGHQHIHQLPVIRQVLINRIKQLTEHKQIYTRLPTNHLLKILKSPQRFKELAIKIMGAALFEHQLKKSGVLYNTSFSGTYRFANCKNYRNYFLTFLKQIKTGGIILCHPAHMVDDLKDRIIKSRWQEYQYLVSDDFLYDCKRENVVICKFAELSL